MTNQCNLNCNHCSVDSGKKLSDEISTEKWMQIINQLNDITVQSIVFSGGEPLLKENFKEIIKKTDKFCPSISIETNGTLLHHYFDVFSNIENLKNIAISLDGLTSNTYAKLRNSDDITTVLNNISFAIKKLKCNIEVITVLTKYNVDEIPDIYDFTSKIGVELRILSHIGCGGRGSNSQDQNLDPIAIYEFAKSFVFPKMKSEINNLKKRPNIHISLPLPFIPFELPPYNMACKLRNMFAILPNGDVAFCYRCTNVKPLVFGSLRENSLKEIYGKTGFNVDFINTDQIYYEGVCSKCIAFKTCHGSCVLDSYWETGHFTSSYSFCQKMFEQGEFPPWALFDN